MSDMSDDYWLLRRRSRQLRGEGRRSEMSEEFDDLDYENYEDRYRRVRQEVVEARSRHIQATAGGLSGMSNDEWRKLYRTERRSDRRRTREYWTELYRVRGLPQEGISASRYGEGIPSCKERLRESMKSLGYRQMSKMWILLLAVLLLLLLMSVLFSTTARIVFATLFLAAVLRERRKRQSAFKSWLHRVQDEVVRFQEAERAIEEDRKHRISAIVDLGSLMEVVRNKDLSSEEWRAARELFFEWYAEGVGESKSVDEMQDTVDEAMLAYRSDDQSEFRSLDKRIIASVMDLAERRSVLRKIIGIVAADGIIGSDDMASVEYVAEQLSVDEETLDTIMKIEAGPGQTISAEAAADGPSDTLGAQQSISAQGEEPSEQSFRKGAADDVVNCMAAVLMTVVGLKDLGSPEWGHARRFLSERATISEAEADVRLLQASDRKIDTSLLAEGDRMTLLREAVDLAALDGIVDADERSALIYLAGGLGAEVDVVDGLIQIALAESQKAVDGPESD